LDCGVYLFFSLPVAWGAGGEEENGVGRAQRWGRVALDGKIESSDPADYDTRNTRHWQQRFEQL